MPDIGLDEIGAEVAAGKTTAPDLTKITLDGDDVPDIVKGKSVAEAKQIIAGLHKSLQTSEEARLQTTALLKKLQEQPAPSPAAPAAPPKPEETEPTDEDIAKAYEENPLKGTQLMNKRTEMRVARTVREALGTVAGTGASLAEQQARQQFAEDFQILGPEIEEVIRTKVPNRAALNSVGAWGEVITYVRGQHLDKIIEHRTKKAGATLEDRRGEEASGAPTHLNNGPRPQPKGKGVVLDDTMKEIARNLGISEEEYIKYYNVGNNG